MRVQDVVDWLSSRRSKISLACGMIALVVAIAVISPASIISSKVPEKERSNKSDVEKIPRAKILGLKEVDQLALAKVGAPPEPISAERIANAQRSLASLEPQLARVRGLREVRENQGSEAMVATLKAEIKVVEGKR